jgi:hypothetical protein
MLSGSKPALDADVARWRGSYMWGHMSVGYISIYFYFLLMWHAEFFKNNS